MYSSFFVSDSRTNASMNYLLNIGKSSQLSLMESNTTTADDHDYMCHVQHLRCTPLYDPFQFNQIQPILEELNAVEDFKNEEDEKEDEKEDKQYTPKPPAPLFLRRDPMSTHRERVNNNKMNKSKFNINSSIPSTKYKSKLNNFLINIQEETDDVDIVDNALMLEWNTNSRSPNPISPTFPEMDPLDLGYGCDPKMNHLIPSNDFQMISDYSDDDEIDTDDDYHEDEEDEEKEDDGNGQKEEMEEKEEIDLEQEFKEMDKIHDSIDEEEKRSESLFSSSLSASSSASDLLDFFDLVNGISEVGEEILMAEHGFKVKHKIRDTLQGELLIAESISGDTLFAIKKIDRTLYQKHEAKEDDGMRFLVEQDVIKEASILQTLCSDTETSKGIVNFVDFFESDSFLYLVTEYIDGVSMDKFIETAHEYIRTGRMRHFHWTETAKEILKQVINTINRLHTIHHCCHLELCIENVIIHGVTFEENEDGSVSIKGQVGAKLVDFGVAEIYHRPDQKQPSYNSRLPLTQGIQQSPQCVVSNDACSADMWGIGMILYESMVGKALFLNVEEDAYDAVQRGELHSFMVKEQLLRFFQPQSFSLLLGLLDIDSETRFTSTVARQHRWFHP